MVTGNYTLPPQIALKIHDLQAAKKWKKFKRAWANYSLSTEQNKKEETIQVATLLTVIGEEAREVFATFALTTADDSVKMAPVLKKFEEYYQPCKNVPFERYRLNRQVQQPGETYDQYCTALLKLAAGCEFDIITLNEIFRDRLVFGIKDNRVRERLLRKVKLTLADTDEVCHTA